MTVTSKWGSLAGLSFNPTHPIRSSDLQQLLRNLVALYEATYDEAAPGQGSRQYVGHDHGYQGGSPLWHGLLGVSDDGTNALLASTTTTDSTSLIVPKNAGPDARDGAMVEAMVRYRVVGTTYRIRMIGGEWVEVEAFDESDPPRWIRLTGGAPITLPVDYVTIQAEPVPATIPSGATCEVYAVILSETRLSVPEPGRLQLPPDLTGSAEVFAYFDSLADELAQADEWLDADLAARISWALNAMYEGITDRAAPGASSQTVSGHDHDPSYASNSGGRPVPMGTVLNAGVPISHASVALFGVTMTTQSQWYFVDESSSVRRSSGTAGSSYTAGTWWVYVSEGIDSSGNPPTTAPSLWAMVQVSFSGSPTIEARWFNLTTATYSETITLASAADSNRWARVPCSGGAWNELVLEVRCTSAPSISLDLYWVLLAEIPWDGSAEISTVPSSGSVALGRKVNRP